MIISLYFRTSLQKQRAQHRSVTALFVGAIAADGKVGLMRESGKQIKSSAILRDRHFSAEFSQEGFPLVLILGALSHF
jgi:hypothetical protein